MQCVDILIKRNWVDNRFSNREREAPMIDVVSSSQSLVQREEREALRIEVDPSIQSSIHKTEGASSV